MNLKVEFTNKLQAIVWGSVGIETWVNAFREIRRPVREKTEDSIYFQAHFNHKDKI